MRQSSVSILGAIFSEDLITDGFIEIHTDRLSLDQFRPMRETSPLFLLLLRQQAFLAIMRRPVCEANLLP